MDPNVTLAEARELDQADEEYDALARYRALDEWLSKGGFLPAAWNVEKNAAGKG